VHDLDRVGMGARIRRIRQAAKLRQWELAKLLGTTQSAVHKYERGVVPEPGRLVVLARLGGTSVEWILTGEHWENGATVQARLPRELLEAADALRGIADQGPGAAAQALQIVRDAVVALRHPLDEKDPQLAACAAALRAHGEVTIRLLEQAWRIQRAILRRVEETTLRQLSGRQTVRSRDSA
jgi:transcriptional regulator with XRE-family HTH domain